MKKRSVCWCFRWWSTSPGLRYRRPVANRCSSGLPCPSKTRCACHPASKPGDCYRLCSPDALTASKSRGRDRTARFLPNGDFHLPGVRGNPRRFVVRGGAARTSSTPSRLTHTRRRWYARSIALLSDASWASSSASAFPCSFSTSDSVITVHLPILTVRAAAPWFFIISCAMCRLSAACSECPFGSRGFHVESNWIPSRSNES